MTIEKIKKIFDVSGFSSNQMVIDAIEFIYDHSSLFRIAIESLGYASPNRIIKILYKRNTAITDMINDKIYIDPVYVTDSYYITDKGNLQKYSFLAGLLHEIIHVISGFTDNDSFSDLKGDNVRFVNNFFSELGIDNLSSYEAQFPLFVDLKKSYTNNQFIENAIVDLGGEYKNNATGFKFDTIVLNLLEKGVNGSSLMIGRSDNNIYGGTDSKDWIYGGGGKDLLYGEGGDDELYGDEDNDIIYGNSGFDRLFGGTGNDTLIGGEGRDAFNGEEGDDIIDGYEDDLESDSMRGGSGNDTFRTGNGDVILDIDQGDKVFLNKVRLSGGERKAPPKNPCDPADPKDDEAGNGTYESADGTKYRLSGTTLEVTNKAGASITIGDFENGEAGIRLKVTRPNKEQAECKRDPLILDLDNDHNVVRELYDSPVYFDLDGDGMREHVAWTLGSDGFLVRDKNANGRIDDGNEMFGAGFTEASGRGRQTRGSAGFDELGVLDNNGDGMISALDADYASLRVWVDANVDGITDEGELKTLDDLGLVSISLARMSSNQQDCGCDGTAVSSMSAVTRTDGGLLRIYDAYLALDQYDTREDAVAPERMNELPVLLGTGKISDLHVAMAKDPALEEMVRAFAALDVGQVGEISGRVEQILLRWTGADRVAPDSRGVNMNARWLTAIERISGSDFNQASVGPNPRADAAAILIEEWWKILDRTAAQLLGQTELGAILTPGLNYASAAFFTAAEGATLTSVLEGAANKAPTDKKAAMIYWRTVLDTVSRYGGALSVTDAQIDAAAAPLLKAAGLPYSAAELRRAWVGGKASGTVNGTSWSGNRDIINDVIVAADGAELLSGGEGDDIYVVSRSNGHIRIEDTRGWNALYLTDIARSETVITNVFFEGQPQIILKTIDGKFSIQIPVSIGEDSAWLDIERIQFSDGEIISTWGEKSWRKVGGGYVFTGKQGVTTILEGGSGNDTLIGNGPDDIYRFGAQSGHDVISDQAGSPGQGDRVFIDASKKNVRFAASEEAHGGDLILTIDGSDARLTIKAQRLETGQQIEFFEFTDGVLTWTEVETILLTATSGADVLSGAAWSDTINGKGGNDSLRGNGGADVYVFDAGWGHDHIIDYDVGNIVSFGEKINAADIEFKRAGSDGNDLLVVHNKTGDEITISSGLRRPTISQFHFSDGTVIDLPEIVERVNAQAALIYSGTEGVDVLVGTSADESFYGLGGDDIINGGGGKDIFYASSGNDQVTLGTGTATLVAPKGAKARDFRIVDDGGNKYRFVGFNGSIDFSGGSALNYISFDDGSVIDLSLQNKTIGSSGDDILFHRGELGSVNFTGGAGNDLMIGAWGDNRQDNYIFNSGFGNDIIVDGGGRYDQINFLGPDLNFNNAILKRVGENLNISFKTGDKLTVEGYFQDFPYLDGGIQYSWEHTGVIETISFNDRTLSATDVVDLISSKTDGDDWIMEGVRDGGAGNDVLVGGIVANN